MYKFIDVNEFSEGALLPSEALKINGEYIENQIKGYRTLTVEGREALSPEITTYETGVRDGSTKKGKRYPARIITVTYQLITRSNEEFREAFNKLAGILDIEDAELIFNDENDKFFIGTPSKIGEVKPGLNSIVGQFEILCLDPFKYSVVEYEATPDLEESSLIVDYKGTYKSFPKLQAEFYNENEASEDGETVTELTGSGDCGYIAFFNEKEKIIQIGDPEEADLETGVYAKSQTLVNQKFNTTSSWGSAAKKLWFTNAGITSSSAVVQTGNLGMAVASYSTPSSPVETHGTLAVITSRKERPYISYTVTATAYNRTETSVTLGVLIKAQLNSERSFLGLGYTLEAGIKVKDKWYETKLKNSSERWTGTAKHGSGVTIKVTGLTASTNSLSGIKFRVLRPDGLGQSGYIAEYTCNSLKISPYPVPKPAEYYIKPTGFGTGSDWHGPSITRTIPADASGTKGAANFTLSYSQKMSIGTGSGATNQLGAFQVLLVSGSGSNRKIVAGVNVYKGSSGKKAKLRFYVNHSTKQTIDIDLSYNNKYFNSGKSSTITKSGGTITFNICGVKKSFYDANIAETLVNEVTFTFSQFGTKPALSYNGLFWAKFIKNNCTTWKDIPNKFSANDVVEADCKNGAIYLNGVSSPALGALGNDWEEFYLTPGLNQIGFAYSDWVTSEYAPTVKLKYREVFL